MTKQHLFTDSPVHPGEHLKETIEHLGISQTELSNLMGVLEKMINEIINRKAPITPKIAKLLENVLNTPANVWNNLQRNYDLNVEYNEIQNNSNKG